jgi:hypothetical protein
MQPGSGAELGLRHFQHPKRSSADFGADIDRFSFIVIDLSLRALVHNPKLFNKYSNGENIIFTANDYIDPDNSAAFAELKAIPALSRDAGNLAKVCKGSVKSVPTLSDFLAGNIFAGTIATHLLLDKNTKKEPAAYVGAYDVIDAADYASVLEHVGDKVEFVGMVTKVIPGWSRNKQPYCFVFFTVPDSPRSVRLNIWSNGLNKLFDSQELGWSKTKSELSKWEKKGVWLSVQGLVDPVYSSQKYGEALSITISSKSQIREITKAEAQRRLKTIQSDEQYEVGTLPTWGDSGTLQRLPSVNTPPLTKNQMIMNTIRQKTSSSLGGAPIYGVAGLKVCAMVEHKSLGRGMVIAIDNGHVRVAFREGVNLFQCPGAFHDGWLRLVSGQ